LICDLAGAVSGRPNSHIHADVAAMRIVPKAAGFATKLNTVLYSNSELIRAQSELRLFAVFDKYLLLLSDFGLVLRERIPPAAENFHRNYWYFLNASLQLASQKQQKAANMASLKKYFGVKYWLYDCQCTHENRKTVSAGGNNRATIVKALELEFAAPGAN
jgi:hypothetical protein